MADFDFSTLVTDRSASDLELLRDLLSTPMSDWTAEQLAAFNQAVSKGAYNYTDLNRVTACMDYLAGVFQGLGYEVPGYQKIVVPHAVSRLPEGYTELEYIQSSGTQYIDTGFKPNQESRVVCTAYLTPQSVGAWLFGSRDSSGQNTFGFLTYQNNYRSDYGTNQAQTIPATYQDPFEVDKDENITFINGEIAATSEVSTFQGSYSMSLFANNSGGSISGFSNSKLYSMQIYNGAMLVRSFVPCTDPDGAVGLYDIANSQFYQNSGTGLFIAGPEASLPGEELDPYTWYESDIPTESLMTAYLSNVEAMRSTLEVMATTPEAPESMEALTWVEANNIEQILIDAQTVLTSLSKIFLRAGMVWAVSGGPGFYFSN